ncbi:dienelactone hydrolase family protein [Kitasatospora sp. NPDC096147]|uniref:dienelactone hydrolase family protein n=1 Tax=Kitasatospora sp. NPDC096147 TaxID=3364093 RepID=UPI003816995C
MDVTLPAAGLGPGVLLLPEPGTDTSTVTEHLLAEGFAVLGGPADPATVGAFADQRLVGDALGVIGLGPGGGHALELATALGDRIAAVVACYGLPADPEFSYLGLTAHVLGHFAEADPAVPPAAVDEAAIRLGEATDVRPELHFYPTTHGFMTDGQDQLQSTVAWQRTLTFLWAHLG